MLPQRFPSHMGLALALALAVFASLVASEHTSNWAVLVCTSRFWFNYRHLANVLSIYRTVKRLGIPDSQIILMLPDDMACNPRNAFPGTVYSNSDRAVDLYGDNIEVDYRGYEVTVENFIRLLTDRVGDEMPRSKRLLTDERSNILVYMTGHGGNEFLKFQDAEEIGSFDLADAFQQMWEKKRYHEILFMIDTCQANTMYSRLYSPNIIATGSSELDQSSYSHHADNDVGVAVIDRYTYYNLEFLENQVKDLTSRKTVGELFDSYDYEKIHSHAGVRYDLFPGGAEGARSRLITDFFGNIQNVEVDRDASSALDEQLLSLSKTITLLRQKEAEEGAARRKNAMMSAPARVSDGDAAVVTKIQSATVLTDDDWWTKKVVGATALARPLHPLELRARPIAPRAIAWSCDAELAIATTDTIHIFLPEYPRPSRSSDDAPDEDAFRPQFSLTLTASGILRPDPAINGPLCAFAGVILPHAESNESFVFRGVGTGEATRCGSSLSQSLGVEWSPNGLGRNLRPVLTILTTSGSIVAMGEHIDGHGSRPVMTSTLRSRTFKNWKILWGLGAQLPIPDEESAGGFRNMDERIVSMSWAGEVGSGTGLLAYMNDEREVVIMGVQLLHRVVGEGEESGWDVSEIVRFDCRGPHHGEQTTNVGDADFIPSSGAYCLKWSPWSVNQDSRTATIAYVAKNYVGFRRVTIQGAWLRGQDPIIQIDAADTLGICTFLSADAFVEWENHIWQEDDSRLARGIIATPFVVKPFQVNLCADPSPPTASHSPDDYLIIHHPNPSQKSLEPLYSLIRLSATPTNQDWYQTNLPSEEKLPQWAQRVHRAISRQVSRVEALGGIDSESDTDSEFDEPEVDMSMMPEEETSTFSKVHPHRFRLWGMAASPGDGCIATLVSKHVTQYADRRPRARILFSWPTQEDLAAAAAAETAEAAPATTALSVSEISSFTSLTTEGMVWESMHGNIREVPSWLSRTAESCFWRDTPLRRQFMAVIPKQTCVFCDARLVAFGNESICERGHSFATCAATGLAILAPGISRICSVCDLRCLNISELSRIAAQHISPEAVVESLGEACGGCGGKFLL
ncbi:hypothetical protein E4U10_000571 [Claviceps purpurea]|nr:hypothetical protein E4U10_000571 [Claviceps purpurea]